MRFDTYRYCAPSALLCQVIRRMIKHDGIIIVVSDGTADEEGGAAAAVENEQKMLKLHPSYEP